GAGDGGRVPLHRRLHAVHRRLPAGRPRHPPRDRQGLHARRRVLVLRPLRGPLSDRCRDREHAVPHPMKDPVGRPMTRSLKRRMRKTLAAALSVPLLAGCTVAGSADAGGDTQIVVGYQSKTINTVTAGTLLRSLGYFEKRLKQVDPDYSVVWRDYDTGAPITAQMLAGKIDIGSMGDYPLLINGSRSQAQGGDARTSWIAVTGYNLRGALNSVVVAPDSEARTLRDLKGETVSASVGSAGHGTFVQAARRYGLDPGKDVKVENQQPTVGASALQSGSAAAFA